MADEMRNLAGHRSSAAAQSTHGLVLVRRRRGIGEPLSDAEKAERWARQQPWYGRLVRRGCSAGWWVWFCTPEGAR